MIVFENQGEIDISAISTFGVSVKDGDSPIGFFGTGLKYALAILLRSGHEVTIWSGLTKLEFGTEEAEIRGQAFQLVTMNGTRLGFTTKVGKTWEMWMAYRELYCNARDEDGDVRQAKEAPEPSAGRTLIVVKGAEFEAIHATRWQFFIEETPDLQIGKMELWHRPSTAFFYRGVKVWGFGRQSLLTYNDTAPLDLTEDRTVKDPYTMWHRVVSALLRCEDESILRPVLTAPESKMEHHLDFHGWGPEPSPTFLKVVGQLENAGCRELNRTAVRVWQDRRPGEFAPKEMDMTEVQRKTLRRALDFCVKIGFSIEGTFPILIVESLGSDVLGLAKDGHIYVAERAFQMGGVKHVVATLIEEFVHLRHGYTDCSRSMQNFLFEKMVSLGEELVGEPA